MSKQSVFTVLCLLAFYFSPLLLLVSPVDSFRFGRGGGGGGKSKEEKQQRRRLTEQNHQQQVDYDVDASTGTVREVVSKEQEAEAEAAKTCDGQLASSMVKATEERNNALAERDQAFADRDLAETRLTALQEELSSTTDALTAKIGTLEELLQVEQTQAQIRIEASAKQADERIAQIQKMSEERSEQMQLEMKKLEQANAKQIANLNAQLGTIADSVKKEMEQLVAAAEQDRDAKVAELTNTLETERTAAASALEKTTEDLTSALESEKKSAAERIEKITADLQKDKQTAVAAIQLAMDKLKKDHERAVISLQTKVTDLDKENKRLSTALKSVRRSLDQTKEDLTHWKGIYENRSYCNMTHISEDAAVVAYAASKEVTTKLTVLAKQASVSARNLQKQTLISAKPHIQTSKRLYTEYVDKHLDKVRPHYNQYAAPLVEKGMVFGKKYYIQYAVPLLAKGKVVATQLTQKAQVLFDDTIDKIAALYAQDCPMVVKQGRAFAKKHDIEFVKTALESLQGSCKQPKKSVSAFLTVVAVIWLYLLRHLIFRFIKWMVLLPLRIVWFFCPLRFLFAKRKTSKVPATKTKVVAKVPATKTKVAAKGSSANGVRKKGTVRLSQ